jgi:tetratricopeptide (TPR) repeat protein
LIHGPSDKYLWAGSFDRELRGILALHSEVARAIAGEIRIAVTPAEQARLARTPSVNPEAYQLYLQGRYYWNKRNPEGFEKAIQLFNQAIQKDPNNALAYSGLADSYVLLDFWIPVQEALPQALAAAGTAVALDDSSAEARTSLGFALMRYQWDWAGAEREFRRAIELNPGYATAHHWYAVLLTSLGRHQEAYREIMRARDLDPVSPIIAHHVGLHFYCLGDYDQSLDWNRRTLEIDPRFPIAFVNLGRSYLQKGMYEQAIAEMQRAMEVCGDCPSLLGQLGHAYAAAGRRGEARRILERLKKQSRPLYLSYPIAEIYLGLGDEDQALTRLEQAHKERSAWMIYIRVEPKWDPLRRDPRFQDLLRRMNFPAE